MRPQLFVILANRGRELLLSGTEPVQPGQDGAVLFVEHAEQAGEQFQQLRLSLFPDLLHECVDPVARLLDRHTALRNVMHEIRHLLVLLPIGLLLIQRRTRPDRRKRKLRHLDLLARPVGIARPGWRGICRRGCKQCAQRERRATETEGNHPPPVRRAINPRAGS